MRPRVTQGSQAVPSLAARLVARVGNPLNWCGVDRCILVGAVVLPFNLWHAAVYRYLLNHPGDAPYVDRAFLQRLIATQDVVWTGGWVAVILVGFLLRRRVPESRVFVAVTVQLFAVGAAMVSYSIGHYTANYLSAAGVAAGVGLILFDKWQMLGGIASFLIILVTTTVGEQLHLIPYAPLLAVPPVQGQHLSGSWLATMGMLTSAITFFGVGLIAFVIGQWRAREEQLAQTSEQLARANDLISRYVAAQVAEQIRLGNYA